MDVDLEKELVKNQYIVKRCQESEVYAQNLYAALCNNRFIKNGEQWTCSWRHAGGLVAELVDADGDYMDYYCSGLHSIHGLVPESEVTDEIRSDLMKMGWTIQSYELQK